MRCSMAARKRRAPSCARAKRASKGCIANALLSRLEVATYVLAVVLGDVGAFDGADGVRSGRAELAGPDLVGRLAAAPRCPSEPARTQRHARQYASLCLGAQLRTFDLGRLS